jgi:secondary thiamine-phosphate synthase enzyme
MNLISADQGAAWTVFADVVTLRTETVRQFVEMTELVAERVRRSGVRQGLVSIQSHHTTTAVVVNEDEPLLLGDFAHLLDRLAPGDVRYEHDDFGRRAAIAPDERANGAAHCRSLVLGSTQTLHVIEGRLQLGRWQRLFLVELDGPRERTVSIVIMGMAG